MDVKEIKAIVDLMRKNNLSVFKLEREGFKITLKKESGYVPSVTLAPAPAPQPAPAANTPPAAADPAPPDPAKTITSPMVGTFYHAPAPDAPPFVAVGQEVTEDTVVCIIEAMKVMNEIKAGAAGTIAEVLVENGKPVQFGQGLFRLK